MAAKTTSPLYNVTAGWPQWWDYTGNWANVFNGVSGTLPSISTWMPVGLYKATATNVQGFHYAASFNPGTVLTNNMKILSATLSIKIGSHNDWGTGSLKQLVVWEHPEVPSSPVLGDFIPQVDFGGVPAPLIFSNYLSTVGMTATNWYSFDLNSWAIAELQAIANGNGAKFSCAVVHANSINSIPLVNTGDRGYMNIYALGADAPKLEITYETPQGLILSHNF